MVRSVSERKPAKPAGRDGEHLVICGGGASAVLLVHALRRRAERSLDVTIVEERRIAGPGIAYSTTSGSHLLNVPAMRMSADAEEANHFVDWLASRPSEAFTPKSFVPRILFGDYLRDLLSSAINDRRSAVQVRVRHGRATAIDRGATHWVVMLDDGKTIDADAVVLATGNAPPRALAHAGAPGLRVINDPWDADAKSRIARDATVALIGSGLTAVDVALELLDQGHAGPIAMLSRHGLLPRKHAQAMVGGGWLFPPYPRSIAELMRRTRDEAHRIPRPDAWRTAIDALRPSLPAIWAALTPVDKERFLRHVRPFWEVHRHRMAPHVAERIENAMSQGGLEIRQGRLLAIEAGLEKALTLRMKTRGHTSCFSADVAINCTGPECDPTASRNPIIVDLLRKGFGRADPLHLGLDTDDDNRVLAHDGRVSERLFAVGPVARGRQWEVTAVPEIRQQASNLARLLSPLAREQAATYAI